MVRKVPLWLTMNCVTPYCFESPRVFRCLRNILPVMLPIGSFHVQRSVRIYFGFKGIKKLLKRSVFSSLNTLILFYTFKSDVVYDSYINFAAVLYSYEMWSHILVKKITSIWKWSDWEDIWTWERWGLYKPLLGLLSGLWNADGNDGLVVQLGW
jgi:hypothetical protein